jgi:hypothetical protein
VGVTLPKYPIFHGSLFTALMAGRSLGDQV